jgi:hypothetical protein
VTKFVLPVSVHCCTQQHHKILALDQSLGLAEFLSKFAGTKNNVHFGTYTAERNPDFRVMYSVGGIAIGSAVPWQVSISASLLLA